MSYLETINTNLNVVREAASTFIKQAGNNFIGRIVKPISEKIAENPRAAVAIAAGVVAGTVIAAFVGVIVHYKAKYDNARVDSGTLATLDQKNKEQQATIGKLNQCLSSLHTAVMKAAGTSFQRLNKIVELEQTIEQKDQQLAEKDSALSALRSKVGLLELAANRVSTLEAEISEKQKSIEAFQKQNDDLHTKVAALGPKEEPANASNMLLGFIPYY